MSNLTSSKSTTLQGEITPPGDKSISHRSLIIASQSIGTSKITGMLLGDDVIATANALREMGVNIEQKNDYWLVNGVGVGGLSKAKKPLDLGNSGTAVRLLMGLVSPYDFDTKFIGDKSLSSRPMMRVITPLENMHINFEYEAGGRLPLTVKGNEDIIPIKYELPVASAQVKSAILLAALNCPGETTVIEKTKTRDHTEKMLSGFGADIKVKEIDGASHITLKGYPELKSIDIVVPSDPSSAAFLVVAALIVPDSEIVVRNVCMNETRTGLFTTLIEMGADIEFLNEKNSAGEKIADLKVKYSKLKAVKVPASRAASMIDEYPILSVAASVAEGETLMQGIGELRVKESDRIKSVANGLKVCGIKFEEGEDWLKVYGCDQVEGGGVVETNHDHRIAMSFLILGMIANKPIEVNNPDMINTSFPDFVNIINDLGGKVG